MAVRRHRPGRRAAVAAALATTTLLVGGCAQPTSGDASGAPQDVPSEPTSTYDPDIGRIAYSADGNQHDEDDWASAPMALAILAHGNLQANLVHLDYNNHIWDSSEEHLENMTESVEEGGERFDFDMSVFFNDNDPEQLSAGTRNLVEQINASTEDDQLNLLIAGPVETAWMALDAADPDARQYVECVTHGDDSFNQTHGAEEHGGHDYEDLIDLGCERVEIPDQNDRLGPTDMDFWDFLNEAGDDNWEWLYTRLELVGNGDISDAGLVYYVIAGDEEGDRTDVRSYFGE